MSGHSKVHSLSSIEDHGQSAQQWVDLQTIVSTGSANWDIASTTIDELNQNWSYPTSANPSTQFYITSALDNTLTIDMSAAMTLYFDSSDFPAESEIYGILYIRTNDYVLSADPAGFDGFNDITPPLSGDFYGYLYSGAPYSEKLFIAGLSQ